MTELELWVIYKDPLDAPDKYVVRCWVGQTPAKACFIDDTLEGVRAVIPKGLTNIGRFPNDDPKILEVWI